MYDFWPEFDLQMTWMHTRDNYGHILYRILLLLQNAFLIEADNYDSISSGCKNANKKKSSNGPLFMFCNSI